MGLLESTTPGTNSTLLSLVIERPHANKHRETTLTSKVAVNEGHFTLMRAANSCVNLGDGFNGHDYGTNGTANMHRYVVGPHTIVT